MSGKVERNTNFADIAETSPVLRDTGETLTPEMLRQLLDYNPETGELTWRERPTAMFYNPRLGNIWNRRYAGRRAGCLLKEGYVVVLVHSRAIRGHRVCWAIAHGKWPVGEIDHINGQRSDNRLSNLRDVSKTDNMRNKRLNRNNSSGVVGVCFYSPTGRWSARIMDNGRRISLGHYATKEEAIEARLEAERRYGYHENHGRAG